MRATERTKWNARHQAGAILSGLYRKTEPQRRREFNDTMLAAAARADTTATWFALVFGRFGIALEDCYIDTNLHTTGPRLDAVMAGLRWPVLREAVEENPALVTMIAKEGPLPVELAPAEEAEAQVKPWLMPVPTGDILPVPACAAVWTNQSPMAHGADNRCGNVVLFRREPVVDLLTGEIMRCPFISGNSIRHSWRVLAVEHLYRVAGLDKRAVQADLHHGLTSGGVIDSGSDMAKVDCELRAALRDIFPAFELLGGIVQKQVCHGELNVHDATLVCRENLSRLMDPRLYPPPPGTEEFAAVMASATGEAARRETRVAYAQALAEHLRPSIEYMTIRQYTKHIDPDVDTTADTRHMLWDTELVVAGAQWVHYCTVSPVASDMARAALAHVLAEFRAHPYLAAANAKGHGLVSVDGYAQRDRDSKPYIDHLESNRETIAEWLTTGKVPASSLPSTTDAAHTEAPAPRRRGKAR